MAWPISCTCSQWHDPYMAHLVHLQAWAGRAGGVGGGDAGRGGRQGRCVQAGSPCMLAPQQLWVGCTPWRGRHRFRRQQEVEAEPPSRQLHRRQPCPTHPWAMHLPPSQAVKKPRTSMAFQLRSCSSCTRGEATTVCALSAAANPNLDMPAGGVRAHGQPTLLRSQGSACADPQEGGRAAAQAATSLTPPEPQSVASPVQ